MAEQYRCQYTPQDSTSPQTRSKTSYNHTHGRMHGIVRACVCMCTHACVHWIVRACVRAAWRATRSSRHSRRQGLSASYNPSKCAQAPAHACARARMVCVYVPAFECVSLIRAKRTNGVSLRGCFTVGRQAFKWAVQSCLLIKSARSNRIAALPRGGELGSL